MTEAYKALNNKKYARVKEAYARFKEVTESAKNSGKPILEELDRLELARQEFSQVLRGYATAATNTAEIKKASKEKVSEAQNISMTEEEEIVEEEEKIVTGA